MDNRQIEYFTMLCKHKSYTKASHALNVSQPSVTMAIQKLEHELGVTLINRNSKNFELTLAGQTFLTHAEGILNSFENAKIQMFDFAVNRKEKIRLGLPPMIGTNLLPKLFLQYASQHSHVELEVFELGSADIQHQIKSNVLDLGICITNKRLPQIEVAPIQKKGEIVIVLPPKHALAQMESISIELLEKEPFILMKEGTNIRTIVMEECAKHHFSPHILHSSTQIKTILDLVAKGLGVSFVPDTIMPTSSDVVCRKFSESLFFEISLVRKKERILSNSSKKLIRFLEEHI